jgi:predicted outer membrane repeat protein
MTYNVTSGADAGVGTLRWAIEQANANPGSDNIVIQPNVTVALTSKLDTITEHVTITGAGASLSIVKWDVAAQFRIFHIGTAQNVTIENLTLENGHALLGGGILNDGNLTLRDSVIRDCEADTMGGGVFNSASGVLYVQYSTIVSNKGSSGGGLANSGTMNMLNCYVIANSATQAGGGVLNNTNSTLNINDSFIDYNYAADIGGGILTKGTMTITGGRIYENTAINGGGGLANGDVPAGGGIQTTLIGVLIRKNSSTAAASLGGGILINRGNIDFFDCTIVANTAVGSGDSMYKRIAATYSANAATTFDVAPVVGP